MRKLLLLIIASLATLTMNAGEVTEQQALQKAQQFMKGKKFKQTNLRRAASTASNAYYVFNVENNGGFVLVSGNDCTDAILGYSYNGNLTMEKLPESIKAWLAYYEESITMLSQQQDAEPMRRASKAAIEPLIKTHWSQRAPYNLQCPNDGGEQCVTGCVATALAQVMYYYKWPRSATGAIPTYTTSTKGIVLNELSPTTFKWDLMRETYGSSETGESAEAVAELMRYCGQINEMDYTKDESGAYLHLPEIATLFNYSPNMKRIVRPSYTNNEWEEIIYEELAQGRPVLYSGGSKRSGHQFICDGYDGNGLFHINWGWGENADGYFVLSLANPSGKGVGGSIGDEGYSRGQNAVVNFSPKSADETLFPEITCVASWTESSNYTRTSISQNFSSIKISGNIWAEYNVIPQNSINIETGWALYKDETFIETLEYLSHEIGVAKSNYVDNTLTVDFGVNLPEGKYYIYPIYRVSGTAKWSLCDGARVNGLIAEISETALKIREIDSKDKLAVTQICFGEDMEIRCPVKVTLSLTNEGENFQQNVYFWVQVDGIWKNETHAYTHIDPRETESVTMTFTPNYAGTYAAKITSEETGTNVIWTGEISISDIKEIVVDGVVYTCILNTQKAKIYQQTKANLPQQLALKSTITDNNINYEVFYISNNAFWDNHIIKELTISEGIQTIGNRAFQYCYDLETVDLPSSLTEIGENAFGYCTSLTSVTVRMTNPFAIHENVFGTTTYYDDNNNIITKPTATLYVPKGTIDKYRATDGWKEFSKIWEGEPKEVTIDGFTYRYITDSKVAMLIKGKPETSTVVIPSSIAIEGVNYSLISIEGEAFFNNNFIKALTISEGIQTIGERAFQYCFGLETLDLPSSLTEIGEDAFGNCTNLSSVTVRMKNPFAIHENVFGTNKYNDDNSKTVTKPTANLYVPKGTIDKYQAVDGWKEFSKFGEGELKEATIDGFTYRYITDSKVAMLIKGEPETATVVIPSSIAIEGVNYAVISIEGNAFLNNNIIKALTISEGIQTIGNRAFQYCYNLETINLPSSLTEIGENAFGNCSNIASVTVRMTNPFAINDNVFGSTNNKTITKPTATLYVPKGTIDKYRATDGWKEFSKFWEGELKETTIDGFTYQYITDSKVAMLIKGEPETSTVVIPSSIDIEGVNYALISIEGKAFWNMNIIKELTISEGIQTIGDKAFQYCFGLETVDLPSSLTEIGENAFGNCSNIASVTVRMTNPFAINDNVFGSTNNKTITKPSATLYVPKGTMDKYQAVDGWKSFAKIEEMQEATIITAKSYTVKYGDELPNFEFISEGATFEGTPTITCEATSKSPVGTYNIVISKGSVSNYNTTYVNGTLTIEKAPLKITAKSYTIKQGEALPSFDVTYEGFKNNETSDVLTKQPTIATTATSSSEAGVYDITASGAEAQNYEISYVAGKLTISPSDGINMISFEQPVDVYNLQGKKVRSNTISLEGLTKGVYIINGKKVVVK